MAEHDSPDNVDRITTPKTRRITKSDKAWWAMLGNDPKLYEAWSKFVKKHNLPFDHK